MSHNTTLNPHDSSRRKVLLPIRRCSKFGSESINKFLELKILSWHQNSDTFYHSLVLPHEKKQYKPSTIMLIHTLSSSLKNSTVLLVSSHVCSNFLIGFDCFIQIYLSTHYRSYLSSKMIVFSTTFLLLTTCLVLFLRLSFPPVLCAFWYIKLQLKLPTMTWGWSQPGARTSFWGIQTTWVEVTVMPWTWADFSRSPILSGSNFEKVYRLHHLVVYLELIMILISTVFGR